MKFFKDWKNIVILLLILIIVFIIFFIIFKPNNEETINASAMSLSELIEMFNKENYNLKILCFSDSPSTIYVILENKTEGITIQQIHNNYIGNQLTFEDDSINDEMADLLYVDNNESNEEKQQYKAYQSWLKKYNITKLQLSEMLDYYYNKNKDKTEIIDIDELLSY